MSERRLTHNGRTMNVLQWSAETGIPETTIRKRLQRGLTVAQALTPAIPGDPTFSVDADDPQSLASLALGINVSALERFQQNMGDVNAWIDEKSKSDPERVARFLEKLATVFDRFAKYTPQQQQTQKAFVNISLNTEARPVEVIEVRGTVA